MLPPTWRIEWNRPLCSIVPAISPFGHHMSVTGAPVSSIVPLQMHISDWISMLERTAVKTVLSPRVMVIFAVSLEPAGLLAFLVSAYSSRARGGPDMILTSVVALDALASPIRDLCFSLNAMSGG